MNGAIVDTPLGHGTVVGKTAAGKVIVWLDEDKARLERGETNVMETYAFQAREVKEVEE